MEKGNRYIRWFESLGSDDVAVVGGKNASLGEMISSLRNEGICVPGGFAATAEAYREFLRVNGLEEKIRGELERLRANKAPLEEVGRKIRRLFKRSRFPEEAAVRIRQANGEICRRSGADGDADVAVRSSATAEDQPDASFAGQQETFLNIRGEEELMEACRNCYASLFTDRAIAYRSEKGFDDMKVALSVGVQKMVRSDKAGSGVMFSIDTETGFQNVVVINAAWGLGENVVQGAVTPDEFIVFKPFLGREGLVPIIGRSLGEKQKTMVYAKGGSHPTKNIETPKKRRRSFVLEESEVLTLADWAGTIERHYGMPMDIEFAKDGDTGELFIVQARPETVQSRRESGFLKTFSLKEKGEILLTGLSIGDQVAAGPVCLVRSVEQIDRFEDGALLVTEMTDPDWVPIMKRARGIITDHGGRTCHAAIVSRELGIPAVVGTGEGTELLKNVMEVTLSCAEGDEGRVYAGLLDYTEETLSLEDLPMTRTRIMMNIASPAAAFRWWRLPCRGVGLARMEFIINNIIKIHPMALVNFERLEDAGAKKRISELTAGYEDKTDYFVEHLALGIGRIAASQYPEPVIVRMSDFKTNEYAGLIGGREFEPEESNPMLGFRGASRYYSERYRAGFALECRAIRRVRELLGMDNVVVMIPFCRTPEEADKVLEAMGRTTCTAGCGG